MHKSECKYNLKISNISGKPLFVTALSNLKKQCFIFSDEECTQPAVFFPMSITGLTTLYVVVRPASSMLTQTPIEPSSAVSGKRAEKAERGRRTDREELLGKGREFAGGIRLVFYAHAHHAEHLEMTDTTLPSPTPDGDHAASGRVSPGGVIPLEPTPVSAQMGAGSRKLFESSIMFCALVGSSILKGRVINPFIRCCRLGLADGEMGVVKGVVCLSNASPVFPLKYSYDSGLDVASDLDFAYNSPVNRDGAQSVRMIILDGSDKCLAPLETRVVEYGLLISAAKGLSTHTIRVINEMTKDSIKLSFSVFIDPGFLPSSIPKKLLPLAEETGTDTPLSTTTTNGAQGHHNSRHGIIGNGVRYMRKMFVTEIEEIACEAPIWLEENVATQSVQQQQQPVNDSSDLLFDAFKIIGTSVNSLCHWKVTNVRNTPITVTPVSDLPVLVVFEDEHGAPLSSSNKEHSQKHVSAKMDVSSKSYSRSEKVGWDNHPSMLSLPDGIWRRGLVRCGDVLSIPASRTVVVRLVPRVGASMPFISKGMLEGLQAGRRETATGLGVVAFVTAAQAIQSFFAPGGDTAEQILPIACYTRVSCDFVVPRLTVQKSVFSLGTVRSHRPTMLSLVIQNSGDVSIPCRLENMAHWSEIVEAKVVASQDEDKKLASELSHGKVGHKEWWRANSFVEDELDAIVDCVSELSRSAGGRELSALLQREKEKGFDAYGSVEASVAAVVSSDWCIGDLSLMDSADLKIDKRVNAAKHSSLFEVPARGSLVLSLIIHVKDIISQADTTGSNTLNMEHLMYLKWFPLPPAQALQQVRKSSSANMSAVAKVANVHISFQIDPSDPLEVRATTGSPLPTYAIADSTTQRGYVTLSGDLLLPPTVGSSASSTTVGSINAKVTARNLLPENVRVFVYLEERMEVKEFVELEVFVQGVMMQAQSFDLIAGEAAELRVLAKGKKTSLLPTSLFSTHNDIPVEGNRSRPLTAEANKDAPVLKNTPPRSKDLVAAADGALGPLVFATVRLVSVVVNWLDTDSWQPSDVAISKTSNSGKDTDETICDEVKVDVIGNIRPCPVLEVDQEILLFDAVRTHPSAAQQDSKPGGGLRGPRLALRDKQVEFQLRNPLGFPCAFSIQGFSLRRAGMRLQLDRLSSSGASTASIVGRENEEVYDTVIPCAQPTDGTLEGGQQISVTVKLAPGFSNIAQIALSDVELDGCEVISGMRLSIWSSGFMAHPPRTVRVSLRLDEALPPLPTEPMREAAPYVGASSSRIYEAKSDRKSASDGEAVPKAIVRTQPRIRVRGATPCPPHQGQFEICLGQQVQRKESLEWMITIENSSDSDAMQYRIYSMSSMDESWLVLGQRRGDVPAGGSSSVALYFGRTNVGIFFTYIVIENLTTSGDMLVLRVSLEVVQDLSLNRRRGQSDASSKPYTPLFVVKTALSPRELLSRATTISTSDGSSVSHSSDKDALILDFGEVYFNRLYRRRSFVISNTSDISLEFQLTSTFSSAEVRFTLSPLSLKACSQLTVDPREKRQVFVVLCPLLPSIGDVSPLNSGERDRANADLERYTREEDDWWALEGEIFLTCRLIKDHQERVKIQGRCRRSILQVAVGSIPADETSSDTGRESVGDNSAVLQLGAEFSPMSGSAPDKAARWVPGNYICVRNTKAKQEGSSIEVSVYCNMRAFEVSVVPKAIAYELNVDDEAESSPSRGKVQENANPKSTEDGVTILSFEVPAGGCVWLKVRSCSPSLSLGGARYDGIGRLPSVSEELFAEASGGGSTPINDSITSGLGCLAEEHFTIYNRKRPSEKYRVPVRLVQKMTCQEISNELGPFHDFSDNVGVGLGSTSLSSFCGLEGAIVSFLRNFTYFWSTISFKIDSSALLPSRTWKGAEAADITESDFKSASYYDGDYFGSPVGSSIDIDGEIRDMRDDREREGKGGDALKSNSRTLSELLDGGGSLELAGTVSEFLNILSNHLIIRESLLLSQDRDSESKNSLNSLKSNESYRDDGASDFPALGRRLTELFFHFFALTDELTLHTLRQSSLGNALMSSVHTGQPAARLAQLLYTVVFSHPVFSSFSGIAHRNKLLLPPVLAPFAKQLLYYMGFFPEVGESMEPLLDICSRLKAAMGSMSSYSHR